MDNIQEVKDLLLQQVVAGSEGLLNDTNQPEGIDRQITALKEKYPDRLYGMVFYLDRSKQNDDNMIEMKGFYFEHETGLAVDREIVKLEAEQENTDVE